ncbi:hypothetical protein CYME_CMR175C [Cyanidioschyzon merolae strain 10D]|uniref:Uncharacterized protein n=1 Tax=Cyanidioschyzon merolae (strain NIES-3377 / 10D) TaxID=280699 RepID=M1V6R6_CYAM1|nr:hypothetical protein CYME_CMR175C [Cyanidioschyzon merolae strain 10D]BAM82420.1 hypothetical protein CYME_CMR175C [Cyanidioschyzon merolae strain 10D]|eukprot:XP_005538456.1 hypothetical protein CYME_CMR175C [Cyanidioschyzon merolae strain 10D]
MATCSRAKRKLPAYALFVKCVTAVSYVHTPASSCPERDCSALPPYHSGLWAPYSGDSHDRYQSIAETMRCRLCSRGSREDSYQFMNSGMFFLSHESTMRESLHAQRTEKQNCVIRSIPEAGR